MFKKPSPQLVAIAAACAAVGALVVASIAAAAHGCSGDRERVEELEKRIARLEIQTGIADADAPAPGDVPLDGGALALGGDRKAACAVSKVAAYQAWQDALAKAKSNAAPAEAECADMWTDRKKQACYYGASAGVRTTQAARDAVMKGGAHAREAVKNVKDDPKNEVIARARAASDAAFAACHDENEF